MTEITNLCTLNDIEPGQHASIYSLACTGNMKRRLLDMGFIPQASIQCVGRSAGGTPSSYCIKNTIIALRTEDCMNILVLKHDFHITKIALAGNPNVGKSSVFNGLTGLHQHTGNWAGKTVTYARGSFATPQNTYEIYDLPGTYSLFAQSAEEDVSRDFIYTQNPDLILVVCDATCLERNFNLLLQLIETGIPTIACVNLLDEAEKKSIVLHLDILSKNLGIPVFGMSAHKKNDFERLSLFLDEHLPLKPLDISLVQYPDIIEKIISSLAFFHTTSHISPRFIAIQLLLNIENIPDSLYSQLHTQLIENELPEMLHQAKSTLTAHSISNDIFQEIIVTALIQKSEQLCEGAVIAPSNASFDRKLDQILTSRILGYPLMVLLLGLIFWITMIGANYPSQFLTTVLFYFQDILTKCFTTVNAPEWLHGIIVLGIYRTLAWVVSVMLPPMAIFFPLFTLLEDVGYLPRVAYNLDKPLQCCKACGKQALCMCMGFGCNAAGIIGCRIIDSKRERLLAILTNNFVPCNGRFPTIIAIISMFLIGTTHSILSSLLSAGLLAFIILISIIATFISTKLLSETILKGMPSFFTLELPPYRRPAFKKVIIRSILDRTLSVLYRAIIVAIPAGLIIWLLANIMLSDMSLLSHLANFLDPFAQVMGLDGIILLAFILGLPANEIVLPIMTMGYLAQGSLTELSSLSQMKELFVSNGWTWCTAICVILFSLMHWPCSTTLLTIHRETNSVRWTFLAAVLPTVFGIASCILFTSISSYFY